MLNYLQKKAALEEALRTIAKEKNVCDQLVTLQKQMNIASINADLWISLPRLFSRSSARFELPMDSRCLSSELITFFHITSSFMLFCLSDVTHRLCA